MPHGFVKIVESDDEQIYIDGSAMAAGQAPGPFRVPYGLHKFETRGPLPRFKITVVDRLAIEIVLDRLNVPGANE